MRKARRRARPPGPALHRCDVPSRHVSHLAADDQYCLSVEVGPPFLHSPTTVPRPEIEGELRLLLRGSLGLGRLLPVAPDHDDAEEGADDGGPEQDENDGYADRPDAGGEEVLERVVRVDEGLDAAVSQCLAFHTVVRLETRSLKEKGLYHGQRPDGVVEEDDRGGHEHGEADEFVELEPC